MGSDVTLDLMPLLIDTDVLIDYLRDQPDAVAYLESLTEQILVSGITVAGPTREFEKEENEPHWTTS